MHAGMKLGRIRPSSAKRATAPRAKEFLKAPLPPAPDEFHGAEGAAIAMHDNDKYGNCTLAGIANFRAIRAKMTNQPPPPTDDQMLDGQYFKLTGGEDSGLVEIDVLNYAKRQGLQLGGPVWMDAVWCSVDKRDVETVRSMTALIGAGYCGVELPVDAQNQAIWKPTTGHNGAPGSWGGHCALYAGWSKNTKLEDWITWGLVKLATPDWGNEYTDEIHFILDADSAACDYVDFEQIAAYINELAQAA